uniref:WRKY domain-containing protein n=1 Tax=Oryza brachyantha TaxID=4533 RepID=J3NAU1_ORYBR
SYFRCTYKDDKGCQATKQIQQKDNNYPPNFQVTYSNDYTCNSCTTDRIINSSNHPALQNLAANPIGRPDDDDDTICNKMIKQEPQVAWLPPPLTAISNSLDETPALHVYQADEMGQQLETTVTEEALGLGADLDDPYFYDSNLLLLYENLMNCY